MAQKRNTPPYFLYTIIAILVLGLFSAGWHFGRNVTVPSPTNNLYPQNPTEDELEMTLNENNTLAATTGAVVSNALPGPGYSRRSVKTDRGTFSVDVVAADMNSTRVVVDTASDGDCRDNCPVLSLKDYVTRNGAYAGINGSYFCPASYASCAGKRNAFDTLAMNKNKTYFNASNNVYSTVPAVIFQGGNARFINASLEWGRDTGPDGVLANYPLLVFNGGLNFTGSGDGKLNGRGSRSFVGGKDNMVYIGIVRNASVAESAKVLHTMGMQNALNLDSGGSTALWHGGYKAGPGRGIPNAILFKVK